MCERPILYSGEDGIPAHYLRTGYGICAACGRYMRIAAKGLCSRDYARGRARQKTVREKCPEAVALGRKGGLVGGKARAAKLTADRRKEIAQLAAKARWAARRAEASA